jgi:HD-like signal output (HDOD) protein
MHLDKLLKQPQALPSVPKVVRRLIDTFEQAEVDPMLVASLIEEDPVLTAKLLKTANSAFFGLSRNVTNAREAMNILGLIKVRALVVASALGEGFHTVGGVNLNQFWRYSLNTANLSRYIALPIRIDENTAFTAGLIHAVGELVMHVGMPEAMIELDRNVPMLDLKRAKAERSLFGYSYAEVGAALAREWKFPRRMINAIEHQTAPFDNDVYEPIAGVIHIGSWRARAEEADLRGELLINTYPDPVGVVLGIDPDTVVAERIPSISRHPVETESDPPVEAANDSVPH